MTTTPPPAPEQDAPPRADSGPGISGAQARDLGLVRRSATDRRLAGVAGGLGRHLDIDPTIIRVAFVVLTLFGGSGVLLYAACWLLVPKDGSDRATVRLDAGLRSVVLTVVAVLAVLSLAGHSWGVFGLSWPLALFGLALLAVLSLRGDRTSRPVAGDPVAPAGWGPPPGPPPVSLDKDTSPDAGADQQTYAWQPPAWTAPPPWIAPAPSPKPYRGPLLFLPTLALIALGCGVLGLVDLAGRDVPSAAYPALALAVCGAVLVVSAWFGRAGGVILLALLAGLGLLGASATGDGSRGRTVERPTSAVAVSDGYTLGVGDLTVDLSRVADPQSLAGRTIEVRGNVGRITVIVPRAVDVTATADVSGVGTAHVFGVVGDNTSITQELDGGPSAPHLTIDADLRVGDIIVRTD